METMYMENGVKELVKFIFLVLLPFSSWAVSLNGCNKLLDMQFRDHLGRDAYAVTSKSERTVGHQNARLGLDWISKEWCSGLDDTGHLQGYLEFNLTTVKVLTAVATQGNDNSDDIGKMFVSQYLIQYSRPGFSTWKEYTLWNGTKVLQGNNGTSTVRYHELRPVIFASGIRIFPADGSLASFCLRVKFHGCDYKDGVMSYTTANGNKEGPYGNLRDKSYDGWSENNFLFGGLGLLVDGELGLMNWNADHWIGWYKLDHQNGINLTWNFDGNRKFTAVEITCRSLTLSSDIFSLVEIAFSMDEKVYKNPVIFSPLKNNFNSSEPRTYIIPLKDHQGQFVRIQLALAADWVAISEISFISVPYSDGHEDFLNRNLVWIIIVVAVTVVALSILAVCQYLRRNDRIFMDTSSRNTYIKTSMEELEDYGNHQFRGQLPDRQNSPDYETIVPAHLKHTDSSVPPPPYEVLEFQPVSDSVDRHTPVPVPYAATNPIYEAEPYYARSDCSSSFSHIYEELEFPQRDLRAKL